LGFAPKVAAKVKIQQDDFSRILVFYCLEKTLDFNVDIQFFPNFAEDTFLERLVRLPLAAWEFPISREVRSFVPLRNEDLPVVKNDGRSYFHMGFVGTLTGRGRRHTLNPSVVSRTISNRESSRRSNRELESVRYVTYRQRGIQSLGVVQVSLLLGIEPCP
jgi:hypothetical protein